MAQKKNKSIKKEIVIKSGYKSKHDSKISKTGNKGKAIDNKKK